MLCPCHELVFLFLVARLVLEKLSALIKSVQLLALTLSLYCSFVFKIYLLVISGSRNNIKLLSFCFLCACQSFCQFVLKSWSNYVLSYCLPML